MESGRHSNSGGEKYQGWMRYEISILLPCYSAVHLQRKHKRNDLHMRDRCGVCGQVCWRLYRQAFAVILNHITYAIVYQKWLSLNNCLSLHSLYAND